MGSKNRHAKEILPIVLKDRKLDQWYVEPFVGGGNLIDKVKGNRIGSDINEYLIKALIMIRDNPESIPDLITEEDYAKIKNELKPDGLTGFVGFAMSYGGKWFGGYRRDVAGTKGCIENMKKQTLSSKKSALKQSVGLSGAELKCCSYLDLEIPPNSIIYCDPPYKGTTKYKDSFDYVIFWNWVRKMINEGHNVFVSEYHAPDDFECVWSKKVNNTLVKDTGSKQGIEKLFKLKDSEQQVA